MSLFVIADLHLSLNTDKPMDVFKGWDRYVERLEENWRNLVIKIIARLKKAGFFVGKNARFCYT